MKNTKLTEKPLTNQADKLEFIELYEKYAELTESGKMFIFGMLLALRLSPLLNDEKGD